MKLLVLLLFFLYCFFFFETGKLVVIINTHTYLNFIFIVLHKRPGINLLMIDNVPTLVRKTGCISSSNFFILVASICNDNVKIRKAYAKFNKELLNFFKLLNHFNSLFNKNFAR